MMIVLCNPQQCKLVKCYLFHFNDIMARSGGGFILFSVVSVFYLLLFEQI